MNTINVLARPALAAQANFAPPAAQTHGAPQTLDSFEHIVSAPTLQKQVYNQLIQARDYGGPVQLGFVVDHSPAVLEQWTKQAAQNNPGTINGEDVIGQFNELKMRILHGETVKPEQVIELMYMHQKH